MTTLLNSSGLLVTIEEAIPTVSGFGAPSWVKGSVGNTRVAPVLNGSVANPSGSGKFSLAGKVLGIRGSIQTSFITGATGVRRTIAYLTDNPTTPTNLIVIGVDELNRPFISIRDYAGVVKALVSPTYPGILAAGLQVNVIVSWDSTQAIDGTRFALLQVNRSSVPIGDWTTNPIAAWTSFQPTDVVLGFGIGGDLDFNGQIFAFQISNATVQGSGGGGTFPASHVFDRFLSDNMGLTDSVGTA